MYNNTITFGLECVDTDLPVGREIAFTGRVEDSVCGTLEDGQTWTSYASASWQSGSYTFKGDYEASYYEWENEDGSDFRDQGFQVWVSVTRDADGKHMGYLRGDAFMRK